MSTAREALARIIAEQDNQARRILGIPARPGLPPTAGATLGADPLDTVDTRVPTGQGRGPHDQPTAVPRSRPCGPKTSPSCVHPLGDTTRPAPPPRRSWSTPPPLIRPELPPVDWRAEQMAAERSNPNGYRVSHLPSAAPAPRRRKRVAWKGPLMTNTVIGVIADENSPDDVLAALRG